jgi:hypothetical protein
MQGPMCSRSIATRAPDNDGGDPGDRPPVRALERIAHRRGLVSAHGAVRSARAVRMSMRGRAAFARSNLSLPRVRSSNGVLTPAGQMALMRMF